MVSWSSDLLVVVFLVEEFLVEVIVVVKFLVEEFVVVKFLVWYQSLDFLGVENLDFVVGRGKVLVK